MTRRLDLAIVLGFAAAIGLAGSLATTLSGTSLVGYDDANIFFVYARNLVGGHGLVYNAGGERVEGFTSPLWLLICSAVMAVTPHFEAVLFIINVALVAGAAWVMHTYLVAALSGFGGLARRRAWLVSLLLIGAVTLTPGFVAWNVVSLMDSGLWSTILLASAICVLQFALEAPPAWTRVFPVLLAILAITRPEALLWGPTLIALAIALRATTGTPLWDALRMHRTAILTFMATTIAIFAFRLSYFGYLFPNTYYAKAGDPLASRLTAGAAYFADFAVANPAVALAIAASIVTLVLLTRRYRTTPNGATRQLLATQIALMAMVAAGSAIPVYEGGDHFGFWRMYQPVVPLAAVQGAVTVATIASAGIALSYMTIAGCAFALLLVPWRHWPVLDQLDYASPFAPSGAWNTPKVEISIAGDMRGIGGAFNRAFPSFRPSVGVIVAGGFALEYRGATIDLMGLNNVAMAHATGPRTGMRNHAAFDPEVFLTLAPDVVLLSLWSPQRPDWFGFPMLSGEFAAPPHTEADYFERRSASVTAFDTGVLKGLLQRIGDRYAWASVRPTSASPWIHAVFSRDCLKRLAELGYEIAMPGPPPPR